MEQINEFSSFDYTNLLPLGIEYGTKIVIFILAYLIGSWLIRRLLDTLESITQKRKVDITLSRFLLSFAGGVLKILLILSLIGYIGIEVTSFIAVLGAASLAIGMALSGTLQNFAGGIMLLLFKPYSVGDFIELGGFSGKVKEIQIFNTILVTADNKRVIIPNAECSASAMINYSAEGTRRVDFVFGIGYSDSIDDAKKILQNLFEENSLVLQKKEITIVVSHLGASSVDITVRVWAKSEDYWGVYFDMTEKVKKEFDKQGISFPFPQQEVTIINR